LYDRETELMENEERIRGLGFTKEWINLGIVDLETLERFFEEYSEDCDPHTEHYRWRAFQSYIRTKPSLDEITACSLYQLGENDPDIELGGSIMAAVLRRSDCPLKLLMKAAVSDRDFLKKIATAKLPKGAPPKH